MGESDTLKIEKEPIKAPMAFREIIITVVREILTAVIVTTGVKEKQRRAELMHSQIEVLFM